MKTIWYIVGYASTLIFCLVPALLLWFLGYAPINDEYGHLIQTYCHVDDYQIIPYTCEQDCNCRQVCSRKRQYYVDTGPSCSDKCDTCYVTCYDITLLLNFNVSQQEYYASVHLDDNTDYESKYPKNGTIQCWYDPKQIEDLSGQGPNDLTQVKVETKSDTVFLVFFIIFLVLTVGIIAGLMGFQWYFRRKQTKSNDVELPKVNQENQEDKPKIEEKVAGEN